MSLVSRTVQGQARPSRTRALGGQKPTVGIMKLGVVGATGLVGRNVCSILAERDFPIDELRVYASELSVGRSIQVGARGAVVQRLTVGCFDGLDLVIFDVEDDLAEVWVEEAVGAGARVIDNSSAFRRDPRVPVVVAGVNDQDLDRMERGIVACANCTTAVLACAISPLHRQVGIERLWTATYQSVSGQGVAGLHELDMQLKGGDEQSVFPQRIAGNVIPVVGRLGGSGSTSEEDKLGFEIRKILHAPDLDVTVTCVRVPVRVGHCHVSTVQLTRAVSVEEVLTWLHEAPGVEVVAGGLASPRRVEGTDPVLVSRVRVRDDRPNEVSLFVAGDNLRRGAALNAVELAESLAQRP